MYIKFSQYNYESLNLMISLPKVLLFESTFYLINLALSDTFKYSGKADFRSGLVASENPQVLIYGHSS